MSKNLSSPDANRSYAVAADWLELLALSRASGISTTQDLNEGADILFDPAAEDQAKPVDDDLDIFDIENEEALDAVFDEIGFRHSCLGEQYPFEVIFEERRLRLQRKEKAVDLSVAAAHDIYSACLLMSCVRFGLLDAEAAGVSEEPIGDHFQVLATAAAAGYVAGDAYLFGHPRPDETTMIKAVQRLAQLVGAGVAAEGRPDGLSKFAKDGGIDVVAWRHHVDMRPSKLILFGQCASGKNWPGKSVDGYVNELKHYFTRFVTQHWLPAIFVPFQIYTEKENAHVLTNNDERAAYYLTKESSMGIIIDRLRLVHWASSIWVQLPTSASEALADVSEVWKWRDLALDAARAA